MLRPGGRLSFIVTNKWMRSSYGEPLRRVFAETAWMESVIDFGHAKQIFEEADVFPSIIVARKPIGNSAPRSARVCTIPREQLRVDDLKSQIDLAGFDVSRDQLNADTWSLEPEEVVKLLERIDARGTALAKFSSVHPLYGIKTGFTKRSSSIRPSDPG